MQTATEHIHLFGIRHHGPGCARSLVGALEALQPDCVLIEGPPEADTLVALAGAEDMEPPVALLLYAPDEPQRAAFYPFAEFSPEWQAMRYALQTGVPVRFMDLPQTHALALEKEYEAAEPVSVETAEETATPDKSDHDPALRHDPIGWLGQAAGYGGGEEWWEHTVEQRQDSAELFTAIAEAMAAVRAEIPSLTDSFRARREALREAFMRKTIRAARKEGRERIAVVCGAWHVPALATMPGVGADNELLKGLPKLKVEATWIPWTYDRLAAASGYGAGVESPAWYEHLWRRGGRVDPAAWFARVARLLREADIDCSSAHLIECVRLAETLAAVRDRPGPGLTDLLEAAGTVLTTGEDAPLRLIRRELIIGRRLGTVAAGTPTVPLQRDLERRCKTLRLTLSPTREPLELDLRKENDLARSQFLYRVRLLRIPWGEVTQARSGKGTFRETWALQWQPEFALAVIEAAPYGNTVAEAAAALARRTAVEAHDLPALTELVSQLLLADLPAALADVMQELENRAALTGDIPQLMAAIPPLAQVSRYGDVRQTDAAQVLQVLDSLIVRVCIGLGVACRALDDEAAAGMAERISRLHTAIKLVDQPEHRDDWLTALRQIADADSVHHQVQGRAARLLFDERHGDAGDTADRMSRALSRAVAPEAAAAWLDGFLSDGGMILAHDDALFRLLDQWVIGLSPDHFIQALPLVRRTFSTFPWPARRQIGERVQRDADREPALRTADAMDDHWNLARAEALIPTLSLILGIGAETQ
ncbi:MAG: DUF5682 family protein [Candidatus Contendobacter sp.]|jgi:hypothetical protein|nr:DUF5682 family protein [Candidatus Contendobacter sp.]